MKSPMSVDKQCVLTATLQMGLPADVTVAVVSGMACAGVGYDFLFSHI